MTERSTDDESKPVTELDLRGVICPYNFVKTKLKLDALAPGDLLAVILDPGEPIQNVPKSIENEGHTVLRQEPHDSAIRILIRKGEAW